MVIFKPINKQEGKTKFQKFETAGLEFEMALFRPLSYSNRFLAVFLQTEIFLQA